MKQLTVNELGVLTELLRRYARECESDYYEAANNGKTKQKLKSLKTRWEAMDSFYDRVFEIFEQNFNMPADMVDDMRFEDEFEKRLIKSFLESSSSEKKAVSSGRTY